MYEYVLNSSNHLLRHPLPIPPHCCFHPYLCQFCHDELLTCLNPVLFYSNSSLSLIEHLFIIVNVKSPVLHSFPEFEPFCFSLLSDFEIGVHEPIHSLILFTDHTELLCFFLGQGLLYRDKVFSKGVFVAFLKLKVYFLFFKFAGEEIHAVHLFSIWAVWMVLVDLFFHLILVWLVLPHKRIHGNPWMLDLLLLKQIR